DYLTAFVKLFDKNYQKALEGLPSLPAYSQHQIVTLASIIEKETGIDAERPIIASVFYNRMAKGMALQSDPTIIYGLKNFTGDIKKTDIRNPHPYNTYVHAGLPPGPICNPGLASIKAALHPAKTDYFYFVSKGDGTHHFSATAKEHIEAVKFYQLP
ncbi:MAG: endolytic transglycosylase MltG, partial [bacterium]|nr:endolytic transglycosylase MltG [bacterium]